MEWMVGSFGGVEMVALRHFRFGQDDPNPKEHLLVLVDVGVK
jgi:hypothetical protein